MYKQSTMKTKKTVDEIIKELWSSKKVIEIAEIVGLNESSIRRRAKKLRLKKKSEMVKEEVVELIDTNSLDEQILSLLLKTKKRF